MAIVNELVTRFTFQGSTAPIDKYTSSLTSAIGLLKGLATAGAFIGAGMWVKGIVDNADAMSDLSQRTGVSVEAFQKLGYSAQLSGSSVDAMSSSLDGLNRQIGLAVSGEKMQSDTFKELGISLKDANGEVKSADKVFLDLQASVQKSGASTQEIAGILRKLRLDPSLIQTLQLSSEEMANFSKEAEQAGIMTSEQIAQASEAEDAFDRLGFRISGLSNTLVLSLVPNIMKLINGFMELLNSIKPLISQGFKFLVSVMENTWHVIKSVWTVIDGLISNTIGWKTALIILGGAFLLLRTSIIKTSIAMLASPITWIIAGIVALLLVVDDLVTAFQGGNSVIASFFKNMFGIDIVNTMIKGFNILKQVIGALMIPIDATLLAFYALSKAVSQFFNLFGAGIDTKGFDASIRRVEGMAQEHALTAMGGENMTALKPAYSGANSSATTNNQNNITINGATDPQKTATLTGDAVKRANQAVVVQNKVGGR